MTLTRYQRTHPPAARREVLCTETARDDGQCTACGRYLARAVDHRPNVSGALGYVETYGDGSTVTVPPA